MKFYVFAPQQASEQIRQNCQAMIKILKDASNTVVASYSNAQLTDFSKEDLEQINMTGENLLDKMDALIIEASQPDTEVGYLLAYAMSQKKATLYLYEKGTDGKNALGYLSAKSIPPHIRMKSYSPNELQGVLMDFLGLMEAGQISEVPSIKFTLRITPQMERYLTWKSKQKKTTKADYLRLILTEELIKKDEEYQKYLKLRRGEGNNQ